MRIYEGIVVFADTDTYYGGGYNADGVSVRRSPIGHTTYWINGRPVSRDEYADAVERMTGVSQ